MADRRERVVIVGGGLTGLTAAHWLTGLDPAQAPEVELLEAGPRPGGLIWTHQTEGYLVESGPQGWMGSAGGGPKPAIEELAGQLTTDDQIIKVRLTDHPRFVARKGRLHPLPQSPLKVAFSGLAGFGEKLRLLREFRLPPVAETGLSVAEWASRRFGPGLLPVFDAMATGIYAGDIQQLSVDHTFPTLRGLEQKEGSILRFALRNRAKLTGSQLVAPREGMGPLVDKLAQKLEERGVKLHYGREATSLEPDGGGFTVTTAKAAFEADKLIVALGPNEALTLLPEAQREGWPRRTSAPIAVVALGFPVEAFQPPLAGFGCLLPESEGAFGLGTLFPSTVLEGRAPEGHHLLQTLVGGVRHPQRVKLSDEELVEGCLADLGRYLKFAGGKPPEPAFGHVLRHPKGIPQLELGHEQLLTRVAELEAAHPGLHFTGMGYRTVAVAGVVERTRALAQRLLGLEPLNLSTNSKPNP